MTTGQSRTVCRRPGELGVHSLDHHVLVTPDLARAQEFYTTFGLDVARENNQLTLRTGGNPHGWVRIAEGQHKKLHYVSFGAFADDMPRFRVRLDQLGIERLAAPQGFGSDGVWFRDPDGLMVEIHAAEKTSPECKASFETVSVGSNRRGAFPRKQTPAVRPRRFSHMAIYSRDIVRSVEFYSKTLGLRLADRAADIIAFCYGIHGSDHHMLAFVQSNGPGLHHSSWEMGSVDNIGLGAMQMAGAGYTRGWGVGRHVLGSNYFHYVRDPWGSYAEYTGDMDYVSADQDWKAGLHEAEDSFYLWANAPPDDFARNYEIE